MITDGVRLLEMLKSGKKLSWKQRCLAKCAECMCRYADGRRDCEIPGCPIYEGMPYRQNRKGCVEDSEK